MSDIIKKEIGKSIQNTISHYKSIDSDINGIIAIIKYEIPKQFNIDDLLKSLDYSQEDIMEFKNAFSLNENEKSILQDIIGEVGEIKQTLTSQIPSESPESSAQIPQNKDVNELVPQSEEEMGGPQEEEIGAPDLMQEEPISM